MRLTQTENGISLTGFGGINLAATLFCGQAFRWKQVGDDEFFGITQGKEVFIRQFSDDELIFSGTDEKTVREIWLPYLDMHRDYPAVIKQISGDNSVKAAAQENGVLHILNQEPWEALCSFIISACNNIPRITKIVNTLCENFGENTGNGYSFPSADTLAACTETDLEILRAGYRVPYILDAAAKISSGEIDLEALRNEDIDSARERLMTIKGVGRKVADCTLLFGLGFFDSYPVDRHIQRANAELFPNGLPACFNGAKGLAQQYIFLNRIK